MKAVALCIIWGAEMGFLYYDTVVVGLVSQVDSLMVNFVRDGYNALADALKAPLAAMSVLSIILTGYGITHGLIKAPLQELYKFIFRLGFIFFFAMNWGNFSFYVMGLFDRGMGELGTAVMKASHTSTGGKSIAQGLQSVFTDTFRIGAEIMKQATLKHLSPVLSAIFIWISGVLVVTVALFEIIVAKIILSICLVTAPLFLTLTLFDKTRSFFDRWLGSVVGFSLVLVFVSAVVGLCMSLIHTVTAGYLGGSGQIDSVCWAPIFLVSCISAACLSQAANIAKHIGGACHTAGGGAVVGGLIGAAMGAFSFMKNITKTISSLGKGRSKSTAQYLTTRGDV